MEKHPVKFFARHFTYVGEYPRYEVWDEEDTVTAFFRFVDRYGEENFVELMYRDEVGLNVALCALREVVLSLGREFPDIFTIKTGIEK